MPLRHCRSHVPARCAGSRPGRHDVQRCAGRLPRSPEEMIVQIRDYIRNYTDIPLPDEALRSYDAINEKLIALMG